MATRALEQQARAYKLYLSGKIPIAEISKQVEVSEATIKKWISDGGWRDRKTAIHQEIMSDVESEIRQKSGEVRFEFLDRQLDICRQLENRILEKLRKKTPEGKPTYINDRQLVRYSNAFKNVSERVAQLLGLDYQHDQNDPLSLLNRGNRTLVIVGAQPKNLPSSPIPGEPLDITDQVEISDKRPRPF